MQRHKKPFPRFDRLTEPIFYRQIKLRRAKEAMEEVLQLDAVDVVQLVDRYYFHVRQ